MTRFVFNTAATLDGFLADTDHSLSWLFAVEGGTPDAPEHADPFTAFLASVGVTVLGSSTYEWLLRETGALEKPEAWPDAMSGKPAFLFTSRDLPVPAGADLTVVSGDVRDHLDAIRSRAGDLDVWLMGGGDLVGQFDDANALDEVQVSVAPATLGAGQPLLPRRLGPDRLRLTDVDRRGQFAHLTYAVARPT
ncbi:MULTISPECIES: dihydrofolate reductase family protein [Aeromicrobium]|uniref:dihydrofolate reductase family protein n=1 Tax=Aeromicrobium TaxID=2040 RepID=UPI00257ECDDF|nr:MULTISPECIES: dihydrofolate reductase family protein [Aeromicrobium]